MTSTGTASVVDGSTTTTATGGGGFGELVLVVGDIHVPDRAIGIPSKFKRMLLPNRMQHILCVGGGKITMSSKTSSVDYHHQQQQNQYNNPYLNTTNANNMIPPDEQQLQKQQFEHPLYEELFSLAPNVHIVAGDYDNINNSLNTNSANEIMTNTGTNAGGMNHGYGGPFIGSTTIVQPAPMLQQQVQQLIPVQEFPETAIVTIGLFTIGLIHGHQIVPWNDEHSYDRMYRKLSSCTPNRRPIDILITGHTHRSFVTIKPDYYHINPGSITGAYTSLMNDEITRQSSDNNVGSTAKRGDVVPSFILLDVKMDKVTCYLYELINNEVSISKTELMKR